MDCKSCPPFHLLLSHPARLGYIEANASHQQSMTNSTLTHSALRSDWSSEKDKKAMDEAAQQGMAWFAKHL